MSKKIKYYAVKSGRIPGIYMTWEDCLNQVNQFSGATYKSFPTEDEAKIYLGLSLNSTKPKTIIKSGNYVYPSISVDAACSGNPGDLEYQGVDTRTGEVLFKVGPIPNGTNNIGEFLALIHGIQYLKSQNLKIPIYTDSVTAMAWIRNKKMNSSHKPKSLSVLNEMIKRANNLLSDMGPWEILKWDTKNWGEIPADFGRK
jgi:ribonuclease HI